MIIPKLKNYFRRLLLKKAKGHIDLLHNKAYLKSKNIAYEYFEDSQVSNWGKTISTYENNLPKALKPFNSYLEGYFLSITNSKFRFSNNHLLDDGLKVVYHLGFPFQKMPVAKQVLPKKVRKVKGKIAYLSNTATNHYGHWLRHILPLLYIYNNYIDLEEIDYFYIGDMARPAKFIYETFDILKIPKEKIIHQPCSAPKLVHAVMCWKPQNGEQSYLPKPLFDFVRRLFLDKVSLRGLENYPKKIYIQRGTVQWRHVLNESEVVEVLRKYNFKILSMNDLSMTEQIRTFYGAEEIVAPHGSALSNLFFIKPKTKVFEIMPYNYTCKNNYERTSYASGRYFFLRGKEVKNNIEPCYEDILVDLKLLEKALMG